jgi:hypothetical protein
LAANTAPTWTCSADRGEIDREDYKPPDAQLLLERGMRHEQAFLETLRQEGRDVLSLESKGKPSVRALQTEEAMRAGRGVIH